MSESGEAAQPVEQPADDADVMMADDEGEGEEADAEEEGASWTDNEDALGADSDSDLGDDSLEDLVKYKLHLQPSDDLEDAAAGVNAGVPGIFTDATISQALARAEETEDYRTDERNFEVRFLQRGGVHELFSAVAEMEDTGGYEALKKVLGGKTRCKVRQRPGGRTALAPFIVNAINAAAGGFAYITSSTGRKAFWSTFLPLIDRFFVKGGKMVIAIPVGELSEKALDNLRSWSRVYAKATVKNGGGLRFFFITEFSGDESYHMKEFFVMAPGGATVISMMSANLNGRSLGLETLFATDDAELRKARKSVELMQMDLYKFNEDDTLTDELKALSRFWVTANRSGWIILNSPALDGYLVAAGKRSLESVYKAKRRHLLTAIMGRIDDPQQRQISAEKQHAIALATSYGREQADKDSSGDESSGNESDAPPVLAVRTKADRRARILKRQQRYISQLESQHRVPWTEEERLKIANMNAEILAEFLDEHPAWAEAITDLSLAPQNRPRSKVRKRKPRGRTPASSSNLFPGSKDDSEPSTVADKDDNKSTSSSDGDSDNDGGGGGVAGGKKEGTRPGSNGGADEDDGNDTPSSTDADDDEDNYSQDEPAAGAAGLSDSDARAKRAGSRARTSASPEKSPSKAQERGSATPAAKRTPNLQGEECDFCDETPKSNLYNINRFVLPKRACRKCKGRLDNGAKDITSYSDARDYCLTMHGGRGKVKTKAWTKRAAREKLEMAGPKKKAAKGGAGRGKQAALPKKAGTMASSLRKK
ncbi:hypothetical protein JCM10207_005217 [Rhodosporidiobolus poonsookiae]